MAGDPAEIELVDRQKVSGVSAEIELVKPRRVFLEFSLRLSW